MALGAAAGAQTDLGPKSAVVIQAAFLRDLTGRELTVLKRFTVLPVWAEEEGRLGVWWAPRPGTAPLKGYLLKKDVCLLSGEPALHEKRIARLKRARLGKELTDRLLAGRIKAGDFFNYVEMAWGKPQRSFMVNYFQDEQHYVYFRQDGEKVLLRFKNGRLTNPVP